VDGRWIADRCAHTGEDKMSEHNLMKHGALSVTRRINASRELVYAAWTRLEHRKHWFAGPAWTEIEGSLT